jgi:hypothetical protein
MTELTQASAQWASRPQDERFVSLTDLAAYTRDQHEHSRATVVSSRKINIEPVGIVGIVVTGLNGAAYEPTNWAFGQLAHLARAPSGYLRTLSAPIAADCLNYGLWLNPPVEEVGVLLRKNGDSTFAAATGPNYGRVWNADIADMLVDRFGDGISGDWRVPGEFGKRVPVTKANTTLYAGDRDMFVFLADEDRRISIPKRRDDKSGEMARGFFVWNSEVGSQSLGAAFFLFDYVCCNRIVWGAQNVSEIRIRHTSGAPDRWMENVLPVLQEYATASAAPVLAAIEHAQSARIDNDLDAFLAARFGKGLADPIKAAFEADEDRPIETRFDVVTAATAYARGVTHQDARVRIERQAGALLAT